MSYELADWCTYLSMYSIVIPAGIGVLCYSQFNGLQKLLFLLVGFTLIGDLGNDLLTQFEISNLPGIHFFTLLQFILLVMIFEKGVFPLLSKRITRGVLFVFLVFAIFDAFLWNGLDNFNSFSRPLASFLLLFFALTFLYKTLQELKIKYLEREPLFWISIGVLIYCSGSLFIFLFTNYVKTSNESLLTIWGIHAIFNIILNLTYVVALWIKPVK